MKIQYCSDLHLEFKENVRYLKENPIKSVGEILVMAGDILPLVLLDKPCDFLDFVSDNFKEVYWVPGNHEYYHFDIASKEEAFHEKIRPNVHLLNNKQITIDGMNIVFSTLWSNIRPQNEIIIKQRINDYSLIKFNRRNLTPSDSNMLHQQDLSFLNKSFNKNADTPTLIVTHHVPTFLNYPDKYKGDALNDAFAVELYNFIESSNIDYWIYGHHHANTPDFSIGKTKMLTNQLGYVKYGEHIKFDNYKLITL